jgi:PIN domain nuclease of toxin-antitoxin system
MNVLLDTHALLWWARNSPRLGRQARYLIRSPENSIWVSAASLWEISIKASLGRSKLSPSFAEVAAQDLERHGFRPLPINFHHALSVRDLPVYHRDPFDRILIAQAQCENLTLVTADPQIRAYDVRTIDASE